MFGYRRRLHKVKHKRKLLPETKPYRMKHGKSVHSNNQAKVNTGEIKVRIDVDGSEVAKVMSQYRDIALQHHIQQANQELLKELASDEPEAKTVEDLSVDKITTGTIDAESIGIQNVAPRLKIIIDDVDGQPTAYLDGKQVVVESIKLNYEAASDRVSQMFWQVEYWDHMRNAMCTKSESNETRRDWGMRS